MNEFISVVLPVYNGEKYLAEAIESILNQTYKNFEFIIIDDGSKDNSLEIIKKYEKQDNRIVVISRENRGLIATLNEGIEKAKGKYIARMDQDDISLPKRFEIQIKYMIERGFDICGGDYSIIDQNGKTKGYVEVPKSKHEILLTMASNVPFAHPTVMIKKEFIEINSLRYGKNGYKNAEDLDLWLSMYNDGAKFGNANSQIMNYRVIPTSMSRINHRKIKIESNKAFDDLIQENKSQFDQIFNNIDRRNLTDIMQKNFIRASWRYFFLFKNLRLLFLNFKNIRIDNVLIGTLSFFKYKIL